MQSYLRIFAAIVTASIFYVCAAQAYTLDLPPVGTNIRYDFVPGENEFVISIGTPTSEAIASIVTFTQGKHLRIIKDSGVPSEYLVGIDLNFHASGIRDAFDLDHISFDESLSLLEEDSSPATTVLNTAIGYYSDRDDEFTFAWDFFVGAETHIYGLKWLITPDIVPGMQLPETVAVTVYWWGAQQVLVVPEPASLALVGAGIAGLLSARRRLPAA